MWLIDLLCDGAELELVKKSLLLCQLEKYPVIVAVREALTTLVNLLKWVILSKGGLIYPACLSFMFGPSITQF